MKLKDVIPITSNTNPYIITEVKDKDKIYKTNYVHSARIFMGVYFIFPIVVYGMCCIYMNLKSPTNRYLFYLSFLFLLIACILYVLYGDYKKNCYTIRFNDESMLVEKDGKVVHSFDIRSGPRLLIDSTNYTKLNTEVSTVYITIQQMDEYFTIPCMNFTLKQFKDFVKNFEVEPLETSPEENRFGSAQQGELAFEHVYKNKEIEIVGIKSNVDKKILFNSRAVYRFFSIILLTLTIVDLICITEILQTNNITAWSFLTMSICFQLFFSAPAIYFKRLCMYTIKFGKDYFKINGHRYFYDKEKVRFHLEKGMGEGMGNNYYYLYDNKQRLLSWPILRIPEARLNCLDPLWGSLEYDINDKKE